MENYISISNLNDFIFCPYSIYLHNVYMDTDEEIYHAIPQTRGKAAHESIDKKTYSNRISDIMSLPVYSDELGVYGKIDLYKESEHKLIERKYQLKQIYQGQIYQLWAQYFCLIEMGYKVESIAFYETSINKNHTIPLPSDEDKRMLIEFINTFRMFNPTEFIADNPIKCLNCIYCNLCDKTDSDNVYA